METAFSARTTAALDHASLLCARTGGKLTPLRRQVLGLILESPAPVGAYDLLNQLRTDHAASAPPTIYRALEFLREHGLVHRIERLAAFIGCVDAEPHDHPAQFLICRTCHRVTELDDHHLAHALTNAAQKLGFTVSGATIEAEGLCAECAAGSNAKRPND